MIRPLVSSSLAAAALAAVLLSAAGAEAQVCDTDADCPDGLTCEVVGGTACTSPACPPGEECPDPAPCEPEEFRECVPGPCETDSDCGEGLKCFTVSGEVCTDSDVACEPGTDCFVAPEPECEPYEESLCAPEWIGPCETDADCGTGLTCVAAEMCECSAGSASDPRPAPDDGSDPAPEPEPVPEPECTCESTGESYCRPQEIPCADASDCPTDWTCEVMGTDDVSCAAPEGGEAECDVAPEPTYLCAPPYWEVLQGESVDEDGYAAPLVSRGDPDPNDAGGEEEAQSSERSSSDGGCQVGLGGPPRTTAALLLLGLIGLARRRRTA